MTTLLFHAKAQVAATMRSPRRLNVLFVLLISIAAVGVYLAMQATPRTVTYNGSQIPIIPPIESEICVGGTIHYPVTTEIDESEIPSRLEIDESWCMVGLSGPCKSSVPPNPRLPVLEPKRIVQPSAPRVAPSTVTPGIWHLWHTATDTQGQVDGYIVGPITVKDCQVKP